MSNGAKGWPRRLALVPLLAAATFAQAPFTFDDSQNFLNSYCRACHIGKTAAGGFHVEQVSTPATFGSAAPKWTSASRRVTNGEMPPKGAPAPDLDGRERFVSWVDAELRTEACSGGIVPGPALTRRLNRDEYAATVRDLLDIHMDLGRMLPEDGAGGEGFDNAAETLFLSPLHSEKYMEAARFILNFAAKEQKSKAQIFFEGPAPKTGQDQAAERILARLLPRAFRRPIKVAETQRYMKLYQAASQQGLDFEPAVLFALRAVLISPDFLFRVEAPGKGGVTRVDPYALASRLSYFLWGSMPDELLFDVASTGRLHQPDVMKVMVARMLRNDRSLDFTQRFVEQWLRTRELAREHAPDAELFPSYANDEELRSDIRFQPVLFFRELLLRDLPLTHLLQSDFTIGTSNLEKHFDLKLPLDPGRRKQPQWARLPEGSGRGGLLGMPAVLAVSSYPYRTSPVLRGAWILDSILGTPPPPPPPDVPALPETAAGAPPKSVRERLEQHRANAACAGCHSRIDGPGFALENYDVIGRWRTEDAGQPLDTNGELANGTKFHGAEELKSVLLDKKDLFVRNLANKMLGYALGRGLTLTDSCAVDSIVSQVRDNDYRAVALIEAVVMSVPFQYQQSPLKEVQP